MRVKRKVGIYITSISAILIVVLRIAKHYIRIDSFGKFLLRWMLHDWRVGCVVSLIIGINLIIKGRKIQKSQNSTWPSKIIKELPSSTTPLSRKNIKKMHQLLPVPNEDEILWAEIQSFGNHPSGIVITDQALVLKAPKQVVKKQNKALKKEKKCKKDTSRKVPFVYRLIPWEHFSPDDLFFFKDQNSKEQIIAFDEKTFFPIKTPELFNTLYNFQQKSIQINQSLESFEVASVNAAINTICIEPVMYMSKNGAANSKTGHGIIAEDLGSKIDNIKGIESTVVGRDNAKNGPDKLLTIGGEQVTVQCKYYNSGKNSVGACFGADGKFRYYDLNDKPMKIEVPKDQYFDAIEEMKARISNGKVPGIDDPNKACDIIRKGNITYNQAVNIAKAGTFESITFDTVTAVVNCSCIFGISFLIAFATTLWSTKDLKKSATCALITSSKIYGLSILGSVISSQLARAGIENLFYPMMKNILSDLPETFVSRMAEKTGYLVDSNVVQVNGARNYFARFLSAQLSTICVMYFVFSTPDIYKAISHQISGGQFIMNMAERLTGTLVGGLSCAAIGSAVGKVANPFVGRLAGFAAGSGFGLVASLAVKEVSHLFREDDGAIIGRLFTAVLINTVIDNMLSVEEQKKLVEILKNDGKKLIKVRKKLFKSPSQVSDIQEYLTPKINQIIAERANIKKEDEEQIKLTSEKIISEGEFKYAM